jgi:acyl-CoA thioesterase
MTPQDIFNEMMANDHFSRWLGIELVEIGPGTCTLQMTVRREMLNGFGIAHGGISFSLADSAFAFACNSHGRHAVSIHCTIEHVQAVKMGDVLLAKATEERLGNSISNYAINVLKEGGEPVAFFRGVSYRKKTAWEKTRVADRT